VGRSEVDLWIRDDGMVAAVEVKTRMIGDPVTRFDEEKVRSLRRAVGGMTPRPGRIDLVTVEMGEGTATIRWSRGFG
jgi:Holliday junction resolvase-like predicted endonuclease